MSLQISLSQSRRRNPLSGETVNVVILASDYMEITYFNGVHDFAILGYREKSQTFIAPKCDKCGERVIIPDKFRLFAARTLVATLCGYEEDMFVTGQLNHPALLVRCPNDHEFISVTLRTEEYQDDIPA